MSVVRIIPVLLLVCACQAATFYTAVTGNDDHRGTQRQPFKTINRGAQALAPGDVLLVGPGTYKEALIDTIPPGQDWSSPVTLRAQNPRARPVLQPSVVDRALRVVQLEVFRGFPVHHVVLDGFVLDGRNVAWEGLKVSQAATQIQVLNCEIAYAPGSGVVIDHTSPGYVQMTGLNIHDNGRSDLDHGIYIAASNNVVENSRVHDNAGWGIHVYTSTGEIKNDMVRNNESYNNSKAGGWGAGIGLYSGTGHVATNNSVWGNRDGILVDFGATGTLIELNDVVNNRNYGILIGIAASSTRVAANTVQGQPVNIQTNSNSTVLVGNTTN